MKSHRAFAWLLKSRILSSFILFENSSRNVSPRLAPSHLRGTGESARFSCSPALCQAEPLIVGTIVGTYEGTCKQRSSARQSDIEFETQASKGRVGVSNTAPERNPDGATRRSGSWNDYNASTQFRKPAKYIAVGTGPVTIGITK